MGFWKGRRVLVTGGRGFVGSKVVESLSVEKPAAIAAPPRAECDLLSLPAVEKLLKKEKPDLVIHLAAVVGGIGANQAEPGRFFYENLMMGAQLMDAARRLGVKKYVQVGTVCSYAKHNPVPFREDDFWNGYPEETNAPYGIAKKALLAQAQAYRKQYGFNAIYLIPINIYGPGEHFDLGTSHVIPALVRKCVEARDQGRKEVVCWGSGNATREFLYVDDAARGLLLAAERYDKPAPVNLGSGAEISIRELAALVARLTGFKGKLVWDATKPDGQPRRRLDTSRAKTEFGFEAEVGLEEGLGRMIEWYEKTRAPTAT